MRAALAPKKVDWADYESDDEDIFGKSEMTMDEFALCVSDLVTRTKFDTKDVKLAQSFKHGDRRVYISMFRHLVNIQIMQLPDQEEEDEEENTSETTFSETEVDEEEPEEEQPVIHDEEKVEQVKESSNPFDCLMEPEVEVEEKEDGDEWTTVSKNKNKPKLKDGPIFFFRDSPYSSRFMDLVQTFKTEDELKEFCSSYDLLESQECHAYRPSSKCIMFLRRLDGEVEVAESIRAKAPYLKKFNATLERIEQEKKSSSLPTDFYVFYEAPYWNDDGVGLKHINTVPSFAEARQVIKNTFDTKHRWFHIYCPQRSSLKEMQHKVMKDGTRRLFEKQVNVNQAYLDRFQDFQRFRSRLFSS